MFERFTSNARRVAVVAQEETRRLNHNYIGTEHLLLGLLDDRSASPEVDETFPKSCDLAWQVLEWFGVPMDVVRQMVEEIIGVGQVPPSGHIPFTPRGKKVLELALREALQLGNNYIGTHHVLLGMIREGDGVAAQVLTRFGVELNAAREQIRILTEDHKGPVPVGSGVRLRDLSAAAREGRLDPVFGRQAEIRAIMQVLTLRTARCPLLVGEHGVGISAVVHGFVQAIAEPDAPSWLAGRQICELDLTDLTRNPAGTATADARLDALLAEIHALTDTIIFLDHSCVPVHTPTRTIRAVTALEPLLASGELQVIAAATPAEQHECLTSGSTLTSLFEPIPVRELPQDMTVEVLIGVRDRYEAQHRVAITDQAIAAAVAMSAAAAGPPMPAKAIMLLDRAAGQVSQRNIDTLSLRTAQQGLADIRTRKDAAIDNGDWDQVAALRQQEKHAIATLDRHRADTKNMPDHHIIPVTEHDIAHALTTNPDSPRTPQ
jgi:ATP-dependent Clp protease ATP-binding subunit ClpC